MNINWPRFKELVNAHEHFLLTSHMRADCDAVGSELGMAAVLETLGKRVTIINGDALPPHIRFIDPEQRVRVWGADAGEEDIKDCDALLVLDTSAWAQLGPMADVLRTFPGTKLVLDHHLSADDLGAEAFTDTSAEATGRLVVDAATVLGVPLTPKMATPLFAAIATDTGWFRFSSVTADTFAAGSRLIAANAAPTEIFAQLYERNSLARVHLHGRILSRAVAICGGAAIHSTARQADFIATGAEMTDTEDVVNRLLSVRGVRCAVIFIEITSERVKVSLRGRGGVDVRAIAEQFGGGGHKQASGVSLSLPLAEAQAVVLDAVQKVLG